MWASPGQSIILHNLFAASCWLKELPRRKAVVYLSSSPFSISEPRRLEMWCNLGKFEHQRRKVFKKGKFNLDCSVSRDIVFVVCSCPYLGDGGLFSSAFQAEATCMKRGACTAPRSCNSRSIRRTRWEGWRGETRRWGCRTRWPWRSGRSKNRSKTIKVVIQQAALLMMIFNIWLPLRRRAVNVSRNFRLTSPATVNRNAPRGVSSWLWSFYYQQDI